jgi:putative transposase
VSYDREEIIKSIQVDGGSKFMGAFEQETERRNVDLFALPPRSPKYNGNVEISNSTVKYKFYRFYKGSDRLQNVRNKLKRYNHFYNRYRPHMTLQNLTKPPYSIL